MTKTRLRTEKAANRNRMWRRDALQLNTHTHIFRAGGYPIYSYEPIITRYFPSCPGHDLQFVQISLPTIWNRISAGETYPNLSVAAPILYHWPCIHATLTSLVSIPTGYVSNTSYLLDTQGESRNHPLSPPTCPHPVMAGVRWFQQCGGRTPAYLHQPKS